MASTSCSGAETQVVEGRSGDAVRLRVKTPAGERTIEGSDILVAAGRTPNTREIGLEQAGIELDARGFVKVDDRLQATAAGVWAMGECAGSPQFTHVAFDDFRVVRDNLAGKARSTRDRLIPYCAFIDPELARVGLDETTAQQQRIAVRVARIPMTSVLRARAIGETRGFMKMLLGCGQRPHPRLHDARSGRGRSARRRADGDARRTAVHRTSRRHPHAPDDGRRPQCAAHERPSGRERNDGGTRPGALGR